jgi:hypothetical protein
VSQVIRYAIATGRAERDPAADLRGALTPVTVTNRAAVTDPREVAQLLRAIHGYRGHSVVEAAMKLAPLVFVRPGELRAAEQSGPRSIWRPRIGGSLHTAPRCDGRT